MRASVFIYSRLTIYEPLPFQKIDLIQKDRLAVAVERDDDAEPDGGFGGGDDDDENREDLSGDGVLIARQLQVAREGDEVQVRRVQNQLDRHEDDDDVAPREHARHADDEEERADDEELREVWVLDAFNDGRVGSLRHSLLQQRGENHVAH